MSSNNPWVEAHAKWYSSIPADRRTTYENACQAAKDAFRRAKGNTHNDTYQKLNKEADILYANLCADFPAPR